VWALAGAFLAEARAGALRGTPGHLGTRGRGLERTVQPLRAAVWWGCAGLDALRRTPRHPHHAESGDSWARGVVAKGPPLSVRRRVGRPNALNTRGTRAWPLAHGWRKVPGHRGASGGSQRPQGADHRRAQRPVWTCPLISALQTSWGARIGLVGFPD
jgi:hypothetical protein